MELGGNGQLRAWFKKCQTENSALEMKYRTKAATLYRENLCAAADGDLASGEGEGAAGGEGGGEETETARSPEQAPVSGKAKAKGRIFAAAERAAADNLAREVCVFCFVLFGYFCSCRRACHLSQHATRHSLRGRLYSNLGWEILSIANSAESCRKPLVLPLQSGQWALIEG